MSSQFATAPDKRYFEDYIPGAIHEFGAIPVDEQEVIDFGKRFVPLPYHVDKEAAKNSLYGGVIASGWHTAALMMRPSHWSPVRSCRSVSPRGSAISGRMTSRSNA